jgi:hypothetical protein
LSRVVEGCEMRWRTVEGQEGLWRGGEVVTVIPGS